MSENTSKNEIIVNYVAGTFALLGVFAVIYKLYLYGATKSNVIDAIVIISQIITMASVVILGMSEIIKNRKGAAKRKFKKALRHWDKKYNPLVKFEIAEKAKGTTNAGKDCIVAQMLIKHSYLLKEEKELGANAYTDFVKIPVENLAESQIMFTLKKTMFEKALTDKKSLQKTMDVLISKISNDYSDIIEQSSKKAWYTGLENGQMTRGTEDMYIHIRLKNDLKDDAKTYDRIIDMLDFMTMVYLAIA